MRKTKRAISKSKTYGFNPWVDQVDAIKQIMEDSGEKAESVVLRKLIDEALLARRKKAAPIVEADRSPIHESGETLNTIQTLLLKLVQQGETSLRIQDVSLVLLQDVLGEAHAGRKLSWDYLAASALREKGNGIKEVQSQFDEQSREANNYAYARAEDIKRSLDDRE
jgi:hypothetical protein